MSTAALGSLLQDLPPVSFAFAYGSAVFQQLSYDEAKLKRSMIDLVFAVDDPKGWHAANLARNRDHYSLVAMLGPGAIASLQESYGARIYYNPFVNLAGRVRLTTASQIAHRLQQAKYGVISKKALLEDLLHWDTLYVSGRMHKPVAVLQYDPEIAAAAAENRVSAVRTSLLLLPERFTALELFNTIAGLSYTGDFRMTFGERRSKISNIVLGNPAGFREMYDGALSLLSSDSVRRKGETLEQDWSAEERERHLQLLPRFLQAKARRLAYLDLKGSDFRGLGKQPAQCQQIIRRALRETVAASSRTQSLKGIISAGPVKTLRYTAAKVGKMIF